ncbi:MAG TPA: type VI secretion system baseplate subunit TssK [Sedimenticola sp.]|nr:type VI secretion system baseplate subunit TssK [Sedimenticola sp.]
MSWNNKIIWSEGLFLRPQHFQQHDRYLESLVHARCGGLSCCGWGIRELELDENLLTLGKFAVTRCQGILPDGTPFNIPADEEPPTPLEIPEDVHNQILYLALPLRQPGLTETAAGNGDNGMTRYLRAEMEVNDSNAGDQNPAALEVGKLHLRFMLERDNLNGFTCIGLARIVESKADKQIILDKEFIPPCLHYNATPKLAGFINELQGLLHHRGKAIAGRMTEAGQGGVAEIADFMLLQVVNRLEPLTAHLAAIKGLHPETLYRYLLQMAGELATFTSSGRRPPEFPLYRHDDLQASFDPVIRELRQALSKVLEERAIAIPLEERKYGFRVALITDRNLLKNANFILAAHADMSPELLRKRFPPQVKVGPVEQIQQFVKLALPGIGMRPLPVAPRQIPYHAGFTYFELDRTSEYWKQLEDSGGFGLHIGGEFPGLQLEFWAVRE